MHYRKIACYILTLFLLSSLATTSLAASRRTRSRRRTTTYKKRKHRNRRRTYKASKSKVKRRKKYAKKTTPRPPVYQVTKSISKRQLAHFIKTYSAMGPHQTGSATAHKTALWVERTLKKTGFQVLLQPFSFKKPVPGRSQIFFEKISEKGDTTIVKGIPLLDTAATGPKGLSGKIGRESEGPVIPVLHLYLTPTRKTEALVEKSHRELYRLLRADIYPALIVVTEGAKEGVTPVDVNIKKIYHTPVILVSNRYGNWLHEVTSLNNPIKLTTIINRVNIKAYNVAAFKQGTDLELKPVIFLVSSTGWQHAAALRGTGLAAWLNVALKLSTVQTKRSIYFIAAAGSEFGKLGLEKFIHKHRHLLENSYAWIEVGPNVAAAPEPYYQFSASSRHLQRLVNTIVKPKLGNVHWEKPSAETSSLAYNVKRHYGQYLYLGGITNRCFHSKCDKWPNNVNIESELKFTNALFLVVTTLADDARTS